MTVETFFQKFELLADAKDAVSKLREVLLDLAVTGHLFGTIDWQPSRLGSVCDRIHYGYTAKANHTLSAVRLLRITDIQNNCVDWETVPGCAIANSELPKYLLKPGDILIARTGGTVGKSFLVSGRPPTAVFASYLIRLIPSQRVIPSYLKRFLESPLYWHQLSAGARGAAQPNVNGQMLAQISMPLPPVAEQKRIVAKVDELMALCDRLEAQLQERETKRAALARASLARFAKAPTPANLNLLFHKSYTIDPADLRKTILSLAVQGKLVLLNETDEPVRKTFPKIKLNHRDRHISIPQHWEVCDYRSLTSLVTSGSRGWKEYYSKNGAIFIRTQNIRTDSLVLDDVAYVNLPNSAEGTRSQVKRNDILITITGANVTKAARIKTELPEAYVSQHIALTRPLWSELSEWLHLCFLSPGSARGTLEKLAYGDKPGLNLNNIRDLRMPIPPLAEQRRIVAKVNQLMAVVDQLEAQLTASRATAEKLMEAVVHELTTGGACSKTD